MKRFRFAGMDPGSVNFGWAVLDFQWSTLRGEPVDWDIVDMGVFTPPAAWNAHTLRHFWSHSVFPTLTHHSVEVVVMERFSYRPGGRSRISEGANLLIGAYLGLSPWPTWLITPALWKNWFYRQLDASKPLKVHHALGQDKADLPDHAWDALGMAVWGSFHGVYSDRQKTTKRR